MSNPIITRTRNGEYSTVRLPNGVIETMWFPDDPRLFAVQVGRTLPETLEQVAKRHIEYDTPR